jgi:hypothetical protein
VSYKSGPRHTKPSPVSVLRFWSVHTRHLLRTAKSMRNMASNCLSQSLRAFLSDAVAPPSKYRIAAVGHW